MRPRLPPAPQHAARAHAADCAAARRHPAAAALAARLEAEAPRLVDMQTAQLLWAHAHLGHGSPRLVEALFERLASAEVVQAGGGSSGGGGGGGSSGGSGGSSGGGSSTTTSSTSTSSGTGGPAPLLLASMDAAVMLVYAQAKLRRPVRALLAHLVDALLAAPDDAGGEAAGGRQSCGSGSNGGGAVGGAAGGTAAAPASPAGMALAACDGRRLSLLLWSLASLGVLPPVLLARGLRALRRGGLYHLSVQSMTHALLAQDLTPRQGAAAAAAAAEAPATVAATSAAEDMLPPPGTLQSLDGGDSTGGQAAPGPSGRGAGGSWDQPFMDAVAADLATRDRAGRLRLNSADLTILARCFALAWQVAVAGGGGGGSGRGTPIGEQPPPPLAA